MSEQDRLLEEARQRLTDAVGESHEVNTNINKFAAAAEQALMIFPPAVAQLCVSVFSDVATGLQQGELLESDLLLRVADEIYELHANEVDIREAGVSLLRH